MMKIKNIDYEVQVYLKQKLGEGFNFLFLAPLGPFSYGLLSLRSSFNLTLSKENIKTYFYQNKCLWSTSNMTDNTNYSYQKSIILIYFV